MRSPIEQNRALSPKVLKTTATITNRKSETRSVTVHIHGGQTMEFDQLVRRIGSVSIECVIKTR